MKTAFIPAMIVCGFLAATGPATHSQQQSHTDLDAILTSQRNETVQITANGLHSDDPRLQAWAAYFVLRDHHEQFIPDLLSIMNAYEVTRWPVVGYTATFWKVTPADRDRHDAMLAVLDAVIQLRVAVSASDAARLYPEFPGQSLILLSMDGPNANSFLLDIFRAEKINRAAWLTAGNLLAQRRAPGFAAAVLVNFAVHGELRVIDSNRPVLGTGSSSGCGSGGEGKVGWPLIGTYALSQKVTGATLLVDGADPTYYRRTVNGAYDRWDNICCGDCSSERADFNLFREHYVTGLLSAPSQNPPLKSSFNRTIVWKNRDAYSEYLRNLVNDQQEAFAVTARRLVSTGLMTPEEAAAIKPQLEIAILDDREDKSTPLPNPGTLGDFVTLRMYGTKN
jgi:hypothetical protein